MLFCSCLLVDELMLSSFHKFVSIFNIDFLISIVNILNSDTELFIASAEFHVIIRETERERVHKATLYISFHREFF